MEDIDFKHGRIVPEGSYRKLRLPYCDLKEAVGVKFKHLSVSCVLKL